MTAERTGLGRRGASDPVRASVLPFVDHLERVTVDADRLAAFADRLATDPPTLPEWRAPVFPDERAPGVPAADVLDFLFVGNAINFQFRDGETGADFVASYDGETWSGAFGMWACLKRAYDAGEPILDGEHLRDLTRSDVRTLFESERGPPMPMLAERHRILTSVGETLVAEYDGRFHDLVATAAPRLYAASASENGSGDGTGGDGAGADGIVDHLVGSFPSFADEATVEVDGQDHTVRFYKRAQLAAAMAYGRFQGTETFSLADPESFTVFADYNLPNVLRDAGVLRYDDPLAGRVDSGDLLDAGGRPEAEIRAATVAAADEIACRLEESGSERVTGAHLDAALFGLRHEPAKPVHRTRTVDY